MTVEMGGTIAEAATILARGRTAGTGTTTRQRTGGRSVIQGDLLYMAVYFWQLVKRDLFSVHYCKVRVYLITFYKVPEKQDHVFLSGFILRV